ncbi:hypothetical protein SKA34_01137 [Photobacterium sp. SKA34]|uniref:hypothetical protein n=1 Tax=Photobacterium sp. SKA34 TaxID=121723 RepID=UPI00006AFFF5|nr:hypothetical protein [Photobacterium sp. SKA34]EAR53760.1 hypothetical protein SKA34_01137 [Photobacterium sp. SKA34]
MAIFTKKFCCKNSRIFNKKLMMLSKNKINFRNEVIHKGKNSGKEQALNYGQTVLDVIRPLLSNFKNNFSESVSEAVFNHLRGCIKDSDDGVTILSINTIISITENSKKGH